MKNYYCYNCYYELRPDNSDDKDDAQYIVSEHCHIVTEYVCDNPDCKLLHIEEKDIEDNIIYFGPFYKEERL